MTNTQEDAKAIYDTETGLYDGFYFDSYENVFDILKHYEDLFMRDTFQIVSVSKAVGKRIDPTGLRDAVRKAQNDPELKLKRYLKYGTS